MKGFKLIEKNTALVFNEDPEIRDSLKELLRANVSGISIISAVTLSECRLKLQKQKFSLLVLNSNSIIESNTRFNELVFNEKKSSPENVILLGTDKDIPHSKSVSLNYLDEDFNPEDFSKLVKNIFFPKSKKETKHEEILKKLSAKLLTELAISTDETVGILSGLKLTKHKIYKRTGEITSGDFSGRIIIESSLFKISVSISFAEQLYLKILNSSSGIVTSDPNEEQIEFAGEICTSVCKLLINKLNNFPTKLTLGVPEVFTGKDHKVEHLFKVPIIAIRYNTEFGEVIMEAAIKGKK